MAEHSKIEWTDHTFNPWIGCTKVSPACDHCYAEAQDKFRKWTPDGWGPHGPRRRTSKANWRKPLAWDQAAEKDCVRRKVFCASLADVFDNHRSIAQDWRRALWQLIEDTPHLDWLLLTKRPQNFTKLAPARWIHDGCPPNVWIGTTVENQAEANRRIPHLLSIPARVRFLSCEPLMGPVDLEPWLEWPEGGCELPDGSYFGCADCQVETGPVCKCPRDRAHFLVEEGPRDETGCPEYVHAERVTLDWIIAGGETGHGARPMHPEWARSLRDQCALADVPFHFKQWGDWIPWEPDGAPEWRSQAGRVEDGNILFPSDMDNDKRWLDGLSESIGLPHAAFEKIGKKAAGCTLDGVTHDGMPG